jgi:DNA-binding NarL/FixJ family response regulator
MQIKTKLCYNEVVNKTKTIRILIADDFKLLRDVIQAYLEREGDMEVVGEAPELNDAIEQARRLQPDVIIVNDYLPPLNSAHAAERFRREGVTAAILAISMRAEADLIRHSFEHGITGFMEKAEIDTLLVLAIRSVYRGERYVSPKALDAYGGMP